MARPPTLSKGDSGRYVTYLQEFLRKEFSGSMTIPPDVTGYYDDATFDAVKAFQSRYALDDVDGVVGPDTWDVIIDMDPNTASWGHGADVGQEVLDMPPELVGERFQQPAAPGEVPDPVRDWEERLELNRRYGERTHDWEVFPILGVINDRFIAATSGYSIDAFEYDPSHGYAPEVLRLWFAQLDAVLRDTALHLGRVADMVRSFVEGQRANPYDGFDGFLWSVAEFLGQAEEPRVSWYLDRIDGNLREFDVHLAGTRLRSASESLRGALNVQSLYHGAWLEYIKNATFGLQVIEFTREVVEEVAEEILIAAATGGVGRYLIKAGVKVGRATQVAGTALAHGKAEVIFSGFEAMSHALQGTGDKFSLSAEMKSALFDMAGEAGGGLIGKLFDKHSVKQVLRKEVADSFSGALQTKREKAVYLAYTVADRMITDMPASLAEAMVATVADGLVGQEFDGPDDFMLRLTKAFLVEHGKNVVEGAVGDLGDRLDQLVGVPPPASREKIAADRAEFDARIRDIEADEFERLRKEIESDLLDSIRRRLLALGPSAR